MFYIYVLLLVNNNVLIISSDVSLNKIVNLPEFIEIKEIVKNEDKEYIKAKFNTIIIEYKSNGKEKGFEVIDNLELEESISDETIIKALYSDDISSLEKEIEYLLDIRQRMLKLENLIKSTAIKLDDLLDGSGYSIAKFQTEKAKLVQYAKNGLELYQKHEWVMAYRRGKYHLLDDKIIQKFREHEQDTDNFNIVKRDITQIESRISQLYSIYLQNNKLSNNFYEPDIILQAYTVKHYNNNLKKQLKELENSVGSSNTIMAKLTFAYSKILEL